MKISFNLDVILYAAAISIGLYTSLLLLFSSKNKAANRILSLLMLAITGWIVDAFLRASGIYGQKPGLYFLPIYYSFAFGPLLYLYVRGITNKNFKIKAGHLIHFVPAAVQAIFYWYMCFQSYETKYQVWFNIHQPYTYRIEYDGTWLSLVIYLSMSFWYLHKYQKWLANNYSNIYHKSLKWLSISLFILMVVCLTWLAEAILRDFRNIYYQYDFSTNLLCIVIYCIGIFGMEQTANAVEFRSEKDAPLQKQLIQPNADIINKIETAMVKDKLYLNPELTLADLAGHIDLPAKVVSSNINAAFDKPFNTYINRFRVDEIKSRLNSSDLEKFTLLGIALESGFNSKTSFNRIFKEFTGLSPSDYVKK